MKLGGSETMYKLYYNSIKIQNQQLIYVKKVFDGKKTNSKERATN